MDRRFVCPDCGIKWFIPAKRPEVPDLTSCAACDGALVRFAPGDSVSEDLKAAPAGHLRSPRSTR